MLEQFRTHPWFFSFVVLYVAAAWITTHCLGVPERFLIERYIILGPLAYVLLIFFIVVYHSVLSLKDRPHRPLTAGWKASGLSVRRCLAGSVGAAFIFAMLGAFSTFKACLPLLNAFSWDPLLADLDEYIHGQQPWVLAHALVTHKNVISTIDYVYGNTWFVISTFLAVAAFVLPSFDSMRNQFLITYVFCWVFLGNVLAFLFLSGGPIYYQYFTGDHERFMALYMQDVERMGSLAMYYQNYLWSLHLTGSAAFGGGISAFPSVHVAMATLIFLSSLRLGFLVCILAAFLLIITMFGSIYLGWHYAIDGYASIILVAIVWYTAGSWRLVRARLPVVVRSRTAPT